MRSITTVAAANEFLNESYTKEFSEKFSVQAREQGTAFMRCRRADLELVFSLQHERVVARDNTVSFGNRTLQIEPQKWRSTLAGCRVTVYEHLDATLSLGYGPHIIGRYRAEGVALRSTKVRGVKKQVVMPHACAA